MSPHDMGRRWVWTLGAVALLAGPPADAADLTVREVVQALRTARAGQVVSLSGRDLSFLDLSGLDFRAAQMREANLHGADLTGANFRNADLSGAKLDRATIVGTDFSGAKLARAVMRLPHTATTPGFDRRNAPRFAGADLSQSRLVIRLDGADLRGAKLLGAQMQSYGDWTQNAAARRSSFVACDFTAADLTDANLAGSLLAFADFTDADLRRASLRGADLSRANFSGANLAAADFAGADLDGANLRGADGLEQTLGLESARNAERAFR